MKVYYFAVAGDTNWTEAFTSKAEATKARNAVVRDHKDSIGVEVFEIREASFPINAKGVLAAFKASADQAPN